MLEDVLRRRAQVLAQRLPETGQKENLEIGFLKFLVGVETFGLALSQLQGVIKIERLTFVPGSDPALAGFISVAGEARAIYHLSELLGLERSDVEYPSFALLCQYRNLAIGLRIDQALDLVKANPKELLETPGEFSIGRTPGNLTILELERLWTHPLFKGQDCDV